jgi:5-methylcytosine-specific restriction endonuclease McrA
VFVNATGRQRVNGRLERTRDAVARLRDAGFTQAQIARELGLGKSTVAYHFRNLCSEPDDRFSRRYDWEEIQRAYDSGMSVRQCAERFGFNLASWHQAQVRGDVMARPAAMPIEKLLVADRPRTNRSHLKARLLAEGLKENRCESCGLTEWLGEPINMQLHHVNGKGKDNRLENIVFLCPNCHSQTENWGGRNGHRVMKPPAQG